MSKKILYKPQEMQDEGKQVLKKEIERLYRLEIQRLESKRSRRTTGCSSGRCNPPNVGKIIR